MTRGVACALAGLLVLAGVACGPEVPPELRPDEVLRAELGLTDDDEVHRVMVTGSDGESLDPAEVVVPPGAWVEFVTGDGRVHEIVFEIDSLGAAARDFLTATDQAASPPMIDRGERYVVSFRDAPVGRYPYLAEGNGAPSRGVVVVRPRP